MKTIIVKLDLLKKTVMLAKLKNNINLYLKKEASQKGQNDKKKNCTATKSCGKLENS